LIYKARDNNNWNLNRPLMSRFRDALKLKEIHLQNRKFTAMSRQDQP